MRSGRKADISHKSDIKATKEDLDKFTPYGELQPRISVNNRDLFDAINQEIDLMRKAYEKMQEKGMDMLSDVMDATIEELRNPTPTRRRNAKTLISQFHKYIDNAKEIGVVGTRRGAHIGSGLRHADGTDNEAFVPEARGVVGKVSRSAAQAFSIPELVP